MLFVLVFVFVQLGVNTCDLNTNIANDIYGCAAKIQFHQADWL